MLGYLKGRILAKFHSYLILDVNNVGYRVFVCQRIMSELIQDEKAEFFIYTYIKEDHMDLFGFQNVNELDLFEQLISISGIGPKTALLVFNKGTHLEIISAIANGDIDFFVAVPRLGKKNAQKIILELRDKQNENNLIGLEINEVNTQTLSALGELGFSTSEARSALSAVSGEIKTVEEKIREALKQLGKKHE